MTLEDHQKRDAHIIKYLNYMINKHKVLCDKYPLSENNAKRKAYKDILHKMTYKRKPAEYHIS